MNSAITKFQLIAQEVGIIDLSLGFAEAAGKLLTELKELRFPNAVLQTVYRATVTRLRQAHAETFQRTSPPGVGIPSFSVGALDFSPIENVADEIKDLIQGVFRHSVQISRAFAVGEERQAIEESLRKLAAAHEIPDNALQGLLSGMPGPNYGQIGHAAGQAQTAFPTSPDHPGFEASNRGGALRGGARSGSEGRNDKLV